MTDFTQALPTPAQENTAGFEARTYRKVTLHIVPLLLLCYVIAYLDRVNVGFAKLQMAGDLHLSDTVYGFGAGVFFIGYFIFEIPSNLILHRVGARVWIARIMITWGIVSALTLFVSSPTMFYVMRFLLGVAEAGFFPGVILYLTTWFPARRRGATTAWFITAVALSGLIGSPISGFILKAFDGAHGLHGWQWLFLIEGLPSIVIGIVVLWVLKDRISDAGWLNAEEKALLTRNLDADVARIAPLSISAVFRHPRLWLICVIHFTFVMGLYGVGFWLPTIVKNTGVADPLTIGLLSAIPFAVSVVGMLVLARSADRHRERRWHLVIPALVAAFGLILSVIGVHQTALALFGLTLATTGIIAAFPIFWCLPPAFLTGAAAAAGIGMVNSVGNLAGFLSPYAVGVLRDATGGSNNAAMYMLAACLAIGALLTLCLPARIVNH